tara:strand:+ start:5851 stop:6285 length:435 start_codon:yes stop_codon:yes gene_type:complete
MKKEDFKEVLIPVHGRFWQRAYKKLMAKISALKSSLKIRSIKNGVIFNVTLPELKEMFLKTYGSKCRYCTKILSYKNIACDHIIPLAKSGDSIISNLQLICRTCNTRKGPLNEEDFNLLINLVIDLPDELSAYVMRKLAKGGRY